MFRIPGFPELLTLNSGRVRPSIRGYCSPRLVVVRMLSREADVIRACCGSREFDDARQGPVKLGVVELRRRAVVVDRRSISRGIRCRSRAVKLFTRRHLTFCTEIETKKRLIQISPSVSYSSLLILAPSSRDKGSLSPGPRHLWHVMCFSDVSLAKGSPGGDVSRLVCPKPFCHAPSLHPSIFSYSTPQLKSFSF
jgi:hypothetical protein